VGGTAGEGLVGAQRIEAIAEALERETVGFVGGERRPQELALGALDPANVPGIVVVVPVDVVSCEACALSRPFKNAHISEGGGDFSAQLGSGLDKESAAVVKAKQYGSIT
jgi:hypothetical protein